MNLLILSDWINQPWAIFLFIVIIFAVIAVGVFLFSKFVLHKKDKEDEKPDEKTLADETLNRYLEDVEDPEAQKQFDEYDKENKDK